MLTAQPPHGTLSSWNIRSRSSVLVSRALGKGRAAVLASVAAALPGMQQSTSNKGRMQVAAAAAAGSAAEAQSPTASSNAKGAEDEGAAAAEGAPTSSRTPYHKFDILYQDEHLVAIDKPQGYYVHPPEDGRKCPIEENGLFLLKKQLGGTYLYPVHRLDRATSGVVVYCLSSEAAAGFGRSMRAREVRKVYYALVRGYTDTRGIITDTVGGLPSTTLYETLARAQLPLKIGRWPTARYSLLRLQPLTGRFHQLRRHLNYISHPIVGDSDHGDRNHNRMWAHTLGIPGLFLRAAHLEFEHPVTGQPLAISVRDRWEPRWHSAFEALGLCPRVPASGGFADLDQGMVLGEGVLGGSSFDEEDEGEEEEEEVKGTGKRALPAGAGVVGAGLQGEGQVVLPGCFAPRAGQEHGGWGCAWEPLPGEGPAPTPVDPALAGAGRGERLAWVGQTRGNKNVR